MAFLAGTMLVWRGRTLERLWLINARAYRELAPHGKAAGIPFLLLGVGFAVAGTGWLKRRLWGWRLAAGIIAVQVLGDLVNAFLGDLVRGGIGFMIAAVCSYISCVQRSEVLSQISLRDEFSDDLGQLEIGAFLR